jgi:hypothetical protein
MRKCVTAIVCGGVLSVILGLGGSAEARPAYLKVFGSTYEKLKKDTEDKKCNVCHYGDSKKNKNDYAKAVGGQLGGTNLKEADKDKIVEALKKAEKEKSSVEGKTFGDLIADGKLPGTEPPKE